MITYSYSFEALECYPEHEGVTDVVFTVHWRLRGVDGEVSADVYGTVGLTYDSNTVFVPYENLTYEIVKGWVEEKLGLETVESYKAHIEKQIAEIKQPTKITRTVPWN